MRTAHMHILQPTDAVLWHVQLPCSRSAAASCGQGFSTLRPAVRERLRGISWRACTGIREPQCISCGGAQPSTAAALEAAQSPALSSDSSIALWTPPREPSPVFVSRQLPASVSDQPRMRGDGTLCTNCSLSSTPLRTACTYVSVRICYISLISGCPLDCPLLHRFTELINLYVHNYSQRCLSQEHMSTLERLH